MIGKIWRKRVYTKLCRFWSSSPPKSQKKSVCLLCTKSRISDESAAAALAARAGNLLVAIVANAKQRVQQRDTETIYSWISSAWPLFSWSVEKIIRRKYGFVTRLGDGLPGRVLPLQQPRLGGKGKGLAMARAAPEIREFCCRILDSDNCPFSPFHFLSPPHFRWPPFLLAFCAIRGLCLSPNCTILTSHFYSRQLRASQFCFYCSIFRSFTFFHFRRVILFFGCISFSPSCRRVAIFTWNFCYCSLRHDWIERKWFLLLF